MSFKNQATIFDRKKRDWFPEIEDFSDSQDVLRSTPGHELSLGEWIWFNPFAYRLINVYGFGLGTVVNGVLSAYFLARGWVVPTALAILFFVSTGMMFMKNWNLRKAWIQNGMNMYDQYLREYKGGNV